MAEKSIFNEIREALQEVMEGRRYTISVIEKLKKSLPDLGPQIDKLNASINSISNLSNVSAELTTNMNQLKDTIQTVKVLSSNVESMKNDLQNMSHNVMALRPILDSIRDYSQRQENGLRGIAQALQAIMTQLGELLTKTG